MYCCVIIPCFSITGGVFDFIYWGWFGINGLSLGHFVTCTGFLAILLNARCMLGILSVFVWVGPFLVFLSFWAVFCEVGGHHLSCGILLSIFTFVAWLCIQLFHMFWYCELELFRICVVINFCGGMCIFFQKTIYNDKFFFLLFSYVESMVNCFFFGFLQMILLVIFSLRNYDEKMCIFNMPLHYIHQLRCHSFAVGVLPIDVIL